MNNLKDLSTELKKVMDDAKKRHAEYLELIEFFRELEEEL